MRYIIAGIVAIIIWENVFLKDWFFHGYFRVKFRAAIKSHRFLLFLLEDKSRRVIATLLLIILALYLFIREIGSIDVNQIKEFVSYIEESGISVSSAAKGIITFFHHIFFRTVFIEQDVYSSSRFSSIFSICTVCTLIGTGVSFRFAFESGWSRWFGKLVAIGSFYMLMINSLAYLCKLLINYTTFGKTTDFLCSIAISVVVWVFLQVLFQIALLFFED